jgi:hypothetical protein
MTGIASLHEKDEVRLEQAAVIFDGLYTPHRRRR